MLTYKTYIRENFLQFTQVGRLRINMGNIYYKQENYLLAVKMYRMTLDEMPNSHKETHYKIMWNIGNTLMRMGQYQVRLITNVLVLSSAHSNLHIIALYMDVHNRQELYECIQWI